MWAVRRCFLLAVVMVLTATPGAEAAALSIAAPTEATATVPVAIQTSGDNVGAISGSSLTAIAWQGEACPPVGTNPGPKGMLDGAWIEADVSWTRQRTWTFEAPGTWIVCAWLTNSAWGPQQVLAEASARIEVKPFNASITIEAPSTITTKDELTAKVTARADAERDLTVATYPPPFTDCPANFNDRTGLSTGGAWSRVGPAGVTVTQTAIAGQGAHVVCAWVTDSQGNVLAAAGPTLVRVVPWVDTSPCVVPVDKLVGKPASNATQPLARAGCALGKATYKGGKASNAVPYNTILSVAPTGTHPRGTKIDLVLSLGPRCKVPKGAGGMSLKGITGRLGKANCTYKIIEVKSKRPKGRVDRVSPREGKRLAPRAKVKVYVSKG